MKGSSQGIAIVTVVLISAIALMILLFASATLTISSRSAVSSERNSTQALLAADSGLQTLKARTTLVPYETSHGTFKQWIETNFASLDLGGGVQIELLVVAETGESVTISSTGSTGPFSRTVVQEFDIIKGPPVPASVSVPAALTSVSTITSSSGAALVQGLDNTEADWTYSNVDLCTALEGEYVEISGVTYRVEGPSSCTADMTLVRVSDNEVVARPGSSAVTHRPAAITEELRVQGGSPATSEVNVTPGTTALFGPGSPITIGGDSRGTVTAVDGLKLTIEWEEGRAPGIQNEGTVVRRKIVSGASGSNCDINKWQTTFPHGCTENNDMSNLFHKTFGLVSPNFLKEQIQDGLLPDSRIITGGEVGNITMSNITWVTDPANNFRNQNGSGILIIETNPGQTINLNVANEFTGLIYVIGNANIQGNANYPGAIIVDGTANVTSVQGSTLVDYDPLVLMRALAGISMPNPNPGALGYSVPNTWRIR